MITIRDVAKKANVSISTVSHVINDTHYVKHETKEKVLQAIHDLNYIPNNIAKSLRSGKTNTFGMIVPDNSNPYFAELSNIVEEIGYKNGFSVFLCNSNWDDDKEDNYIKLLINKKVDGILLISSHKQNNRLINLSVSEIPIILSDCNIPDKEAIDHVVIDNYHGGYQATRHLILLNHKRIACITGPNQLSPSADRTKGYLKAHQDFGIKNDKSLVIKGDFLYQGGLEAMEKLLGFSDPPTAVFACNDMMALGALKAINSAGLKVPNQISIVGYDDIYLAAAFTPSLTTVAQPIRELATISTNRLIEKIEEMNSGIIRNTHTILKPQLVIRNSTTINRNP